MNKLSEWANRYRWRARLLIAGGDSLLGLIGIATGLFLFNTGFHLPAPFIVVIAWGSLVVYYLFPVEKTDTTYGLRLNCHRAIYALMFLLFVICGNRLPGLIDEAHSIREVAVPVFIVGKYEKIKIQPKPTIHWNQSPRRSHQRTSGQFFKTKLKVAMAKLQVRHESPPSVRACGLLILGGIAAIYLIMLLARLSSGPQCSGAGLAISLLSIVATGALVGIAVLTVMGIKLLAGQ